MNTKSAFVAIVGKPNAGKSSLLNLMVGEKVAIVSPKPQTTRTRITGVITKDETQLVFIDTPGIHKPRTKLSEYMVQEIRQSVTDVDVAVLVTDAAGEIRTAELELVESIKSRKIPAILVVNKIDLLEQKELMMQKITEFSKLLAFDHIVPISVIKRDGTDMLFCLIEGYAKPGPHFFDDDAYTDQPERVIVSEIVREKLLQNMRDEIPHGIAVGIEKMKERDNKGLGSGIIDIEAIIYCEKESHKAMIIGKKGASLKKIGTQARVSIEDFLDAKVNLQCWVKVKEDWRNRSGQLREFGFRS